MKTLHIIILSAILLILAGGTTSCKKNDKENAPLEMGLYVETEPFAPQSPRGSTIRFIDNERLVLRLNQGGGVTESESFYEIRDSSINLWLVETPDMRPIRLHFRIINRRKFEIGYLHIRFGLPQHYPHMTFEKISDN